MIQLVDHDGFTVKMSKAGIAHSLEIMGNPAGEYTLLTQDGKALDEFDVIQFRACKMPKYSLYARLMKRLQWMMKERKRRQAFDAVNDRGLIWKSTPFVLKTPWLRLKGQEPIIINV